jgi:hypothetical protein
MRPEELRLALAGVALLSASLFFVAASLLKYELGIGFLFDPLEALLSDPQRLRVFTWSHPWFSWAGWVSRWR